MAGTVQRSDAARGESTPLHLHQHAERRVIVHVDLTGSRLGSAYRSVELELAPPDDWDDDRIRHETAVFYGVGRANVEGPWPKTWDDDRNCQSGGNL